MFYAVATVMGAIDPGMGFFMALCEDEGQAAILAASMRLSQGKKG